MSVQRILLGSSASVTETMTDGLGVVPSPAPTAVTVDITNAAGDDIGSGIAAVSAAAPADFSVAINTAMTTSLDRLTLVWTWGVGRTTTTYVEVVGGFLFTIAELRQIGPLGSDANYSNVTLANVRSAVEDAIEAQLGYALVPRFRTTRFGVPLSTVRLAPYLRSVRSISDDGTDVDVADVTYDYTGYVTGYSFTGPTVFGFEHGLDAPSPQATAAALLLAKTWAIKGPIDDRTTSFTSDVGITSQLLTPGIGGSIFGLPAVDQWITSERLIGAA